MSMTIPQLQLISEELSPKLSLGVVRKVISIDPKTFCFELRIPGENLFPLFSLSTSFARFLNEAQRPKKEKVPSSFSLLLKKELLNSRSESFKSSKKDRWLEWTFNTLDGPRYLVAELSDRHGNIFLLDKKRNILGSLLPNKSTRRELVVSKRYQPPAPLPEEIFNRLNQDNFKLEQLPPDGSRNEKLCQHFNNLIEENRLQTLRQKLGKRIRAEIKQLKRREKAITKDLNKAIEAQQYRKWGELLQSVYGQIKKGEPEVQVVDYYHPQQERITIQLDQRLDLSENVQRYFKLYRKFSGAIDQIENRLQDCQNALETLQIVETESLSESELLSITEDLEIKNFLKPIRPTQSSKTKQRSSPALPYREFLSLSGKKILVGKGGKHNDALSLRVAKGNDLWLHALDWPGAHVLVRLEKKEAIDEESLLDAATLAAFYSKGTKSQKECIGTTLDIGYTRAKNIRKPKGFPPGRVSYVEAKTLSIRIEEDRLARLLDRKGAPS